MNKAFTLVELAIVIVIIGLLVGGVLQGQELIRQAKLRKLSTQIEGYKAAILTFKAKYNALPGDMKNATQMWGTYASCDNVPTQGVLTCNGNGDGNIGLWGTGAHNYEWGTFWQHLNNARLIPTWEMKTRLTNDWGPEGPLDSSSFGLLNTNVINYVQSGAGVGGFSGHYGHFFVFGRSQGGHPWYGIMPPEDAFSFDTKYDDGLPGTGTFSTLAQGSPFTPNCATTTNPSTATYNLSYTGKDCSFLIKLNL